MHVCLARASHHAHTRVYEAHAWYSWPACRQTHVHTPTHVHSTHTCTPSAVSPARVSHTDAHSGSFSHSLPAQPPLAHLSTTPRGMQGLVECIISIIWSIFFLPVGAQLASILSNGATSMCLAASALQASGSLITATASTLASAVPFASPFVRHRKLLELAATGGRSLLQFGGLMTGMVNAAAAYAQAICAISAVLTALGFLGFVLFGVGAFLAIKYDMLQGRGLWVPKCESRWIMGLTQPMDTGGRCMFV